MQINLLDKTVTDGGEFNRLLARARSKKCILDSEKHIEEYYKIPKSELEHNPKLKYHVISVLEALKKKERSYKYFTPTGLPELCHIFSDSHNEIEKLGYHIYFSDKKSVVLSMESFLDISLQKCCNANPALIRAMPDYDLLSFYMMNLSLDKYKPVVNLRQFRGIDSAFDSYLEMIVSNSSAFYDSSEEDDEKQRNINVFLGLYYGIVSAATNILMECSKLLYKRYHLAIRSQGFSNIVFNTLDTSIKLPQSIHYVDSDVEFDLPIQVYSKGEYLSYLRG